METQAMASAKTFEGPATSSLSITVDSALANVLSFPPFCEQGEMPLSDLAFDEGIREQIRTMKDIPKAMLLLYTPGGENALDIIDPGLQTVPYTYILIANLSALSSPTEGINLETLWQKLIDFLTRFDPKQIRYLGNEFKMIFEAFSTISLTIKQVTIGVALMANALLRIDPAGAVLTSNHVHLAKLAINTRNYAALGPLLENIILYIPDSSNLPKPHHLSDLNLNPSLFITASSGFTRNLSRTDILEYFFCCGLACLGEKKWAKASDHFECAITYPAKDAISKIMIEAYKKWVLTRLVCQGRVSEIPKSINSTAARTYHLLSKSYEKLAYIFENNSAFRLKKEVESEYDLWKSDCNMGLVREVLASYQKFQIRNLANVYSKISIQEVHEKTESAETGGKLSSIREVESLISNMIDQGELHATMSSSPQGTSVLTFSPTGLILSEAQMQKKLIASAARTQYIIKEINFTDKNLCLDREYIRYTQRQKKKSRQEQNQQVQPEGSWMEAEDEDIMGVY